MDLDNNEPKLPLTMNPAHWSAGTVFEMKSHFVHYGQTFVGPFIDKIEFSVSKHFFTKKYIRYGMSSTFYSYKFDRSRNDALWVVDINVTDGEKMRIHPHGQKASELNTNLVDYHLIIKNNGIRIGKQEKYFFGLLTRIKR